MRGDVAGAVAGCQTVPPPVHPAHPAPRRRGVLRRLFETRGLLGGHAAPHVTTRLRARDGTALVGSYLPGRGGRAAVLLLHGFGAQRRKPSYARLADGLSAHLPVLALDLRGHGDSGGWCTFGDREEADVAAGLDWLHRVGHDRVVLVGLSMGATAAIHAASVGARTAGVVAVSAPAWFREVPETDATRRLKRIWNSRTRRRLLRLLVKVRLAGPTSWTSPGHPVEMIARVRAPLLVVHGEDDAYFPVSDAQELVEAAGGAATLWREPEGFGHAEDGISPSFPDDLAAAIGAALADGAFPRRRT